MGGKDMLTKKEIETLRKISRKEGIKGDRYIEDFIWRNTVKPKFKVGDVVEFTDRHRYICDKPVVGWLVKITKTKYDTYYKTVTYEAEAPYTVNGEQKIFNCVVQEYGTKKSRKKDLPVHQFSYNGKCYDCMDAIGLNF